MRGLWGVLETMEGGERRGRDTGDTGEGGREEGRRLSSEAAGTLTKNPQDVSWPREGWMRNEGEEERWKLGMF